LFGIVLITYPPKKAEEVARALLSSRLAACVTIMPKVSSLYRWKENTVTDEEALLVVKTEIDRFEDLSKCVKEVHPYDVPEIIALPVVRGNNDYLEWVDCVLKSRK
jgi:periplasmic divalent cation tolerance protein